MLEPWGYEVDEHRFGRLASIIASTVGSKISAKEFEHLPSEIVKETKLKDDPVYQLRKLLPNSVDEGSDSDVSTTGAKI